MVQMHVYRVGMDPQRRPLVILADDEEKRLLPIWIGPFEAHSIAIYLEGQSFPRPLTHDLLNSVIESLGYALQQVDIVRLEGRTYYGLLQIVGPNGHFAVDSRPSDAIALALRAETHIYVAEEVLEEAQTFDEIEEGDDIEKFRHLLDGIEPENLEPDSTEDES